jgi:hypothetical protein
MVRGQKNLEPVHHIAIRRVREARAALDVVDLEIADRVEEITRQLRTEAEEEVRTRIWKALDMGVPKENLKDVMGISNHKTFMDKWVRSYIPPADPFADAWFVFERGDEYDSVRFLFDKQLALGLRLVDGLIEWDDEASAWFAAHPEFGQWGQENGYGWDEFEESYVKFVEGGN